jgi:uncharacterized membrane protein YgdD (TMEM256/DUF423 family)
MERIWVAAGALAGLSGLAMAAATAHALAPRLDPAQAEALRGAVQMQLVHALALLACGLWVGRGGGLAQWAGAAFLIGMLGFCGAIYARALFAVGLPMLAPAGGMALMAGWVLLALSALWPRGA